MYSIDLYRQCINKINNMGISLPFFQVIWLKIHGFVHFV